MLLGCGIKGSFLVLGHADMEASIVTHVLLQVYIDCSILLIATWSDIDDVWA